MSPTVADYDEAVKRIGEQVPIDAETESDIRQALRDSNDPQLTDNVIDNMADALVSTGDVIEALSQLGETPTDDEIDSISDALDEYEMDDRADSIAESVSEEVVTESDIEEAVGARKNSTDQLYREDIEEAVEEISEEKEIVGTSEEQITQSRAEQEGAPARSDVQRARAQAANPDDAVTPADRDDLSSDSNTPLNIIEGSDGEPVGAVGGASQGGVSPDQTAEELGVEYLGGIEDVAGSTEISGSGESVDLEIAGSKVGEVEI